MRRRHGFTLVEMMVAMALVIFIMVILSEAFVTGLESFRLLKAQGDMQERLRSVAVLLRRDLAADHFAGSNFNGNGGPRLSDQRMGTFQSWQPPDQGFFRIRQGAHKVEDSDAGGDNLPSKRATDDILHFTIIVKGDRRENFLSGAFPPNLPQAPLVSSKGPPDFQEDGTYKSQWAEVAYYLKPAPGNPTANGTPLFALYRRQVVIPAKKDADDLNGQVNHSPSKLPPDPPAQLPAGQGHDEYYYELGCKSDYINPPYLHFTDPSDLTIPERRFAMNFNPNTGGIPLPNGYPTLRDQLNNAASHGDDLLLTDVVSFETKLIGKAGSSFVLHTLWDSFFTHKNPQFLNQVRVFDTWSKITTGPYDYGNGKWKQGWVGVGGPTNATIPSRPPENWTISGLQITIRVWDARTQQTRQITITQDV